MAKSIASKISIQMKQNAINDSLHVSQRNSYVVDIGGTEAWRTTGQVWADERGKQEFRIFDDQTLSSFDFNLKIINNNDALKSKSTALYVVIINNWELALETTIGPFDKLTSLEAIGTRAKEQAYLKLRTKMNDLPKQVEAEIKLNKKLSHVYVHVMASLLVYDHPDVSKDIVQPKRFTFVSFPESLVRYHLKGVSEIKKLGGKAALIQENIRLFGEQFIQRTEINLAFNYSIPLEERENLDRGLAKPVREINALPDDPKHAVYDYTNLISDDTKLAKLEQLGEDLRKGNGSGVFVKNFYTDYRMSAAQLEAIKKYANNLGKNDMVAWIHLEDPEGHVTAGLYFGPGLQERLSKDFIDHTNEFLFESLKVYHKFSSIPFQALGWVAGGLSKLMSMVKIDSIYYDPTLGPSYDPILFDLYYIGRTATTAGTGIIARSITSDEDDFRLKIEEGLRADINDKQLEFAFVTGLWNGVVTELQGLPDGVEMLCNAYTDPPSIESVKTVVNSVLNGQAFSAIRDKIKSRYSSISHSDFAIIHHAGRDVVAVASVFVVLGQVTGAIKMSKSLQLLAKISQSLDLITLTRYAVRLANGVKLYRLGQKSVAFLKVAGTETQQLIKLVDRAGNILKNTDLRLVQQVQLTEVGASMRTVTLLVDPTENLKGAILEMKQLFKDSYGNKAVQIVDEGGAHLAVEVSDASKLVDDAEGIANLLVSVRKRVPEELWEKFYADFGQNSEMLRKFDSEPGLVEAWKHLDDLGTEVVPAALRRNPKLLEAVNAPKGSRKAPSTYLDADYIANHLKKFEDGSSRIVLKDTYLRRGVGKPDAGRTEFVFPKSEMDEILNLPNAEKAKKLGIPESQLDGELVRIDFKSTDKIEMPSGNEFGANDQWIPGGKTDGGVSEAIVKTEGMQLDVDYTVTDL